MSRLASVDVFRAIAIFFVILIHTTPFKALSLSFGYELDIALAINQIARFAVPFFYVVSGFFWAGKVGDETQVIGVTVKMLKRLTFLFFAWSVIYLFPSDIVSSLSYGPAGPIKLTFWNLVRCFNNPLVTLMEGTKVHLWFLVGLMCSVAISALFIIFSQERALIVVAVVLYAVGLLGKAYSDTPVGFYSDFDFRDGPFFSLIFFVTGYFLAKTTSSFLWFRFGYLFSTLGFALHFMELLVLNKFWGATMAQDYVVGTYFLGVGVALIALSNRIRTQSTIPAAVGPLVLGIYVSHLIFVDLLSPINRIFSGNAVWDISYPIAVFLLALGFTAILSRNRCTKILVI